MIDQFTGKECFYRPLYTSTMRSSKVVKTKSMFNAQTRKETVFLVLENGDIMPADRVYFTSPLQSAETDAQPGAHEVDPIKMELQGHRTVGGDHLEISAKMRSERSNMLERLIDGALRWLGEFKENGPGANVYAKNITISSK